MTPEEMKKVQQQVAVVVGLLDLLHLLGGHGCHSLFAKYSPQQ